MGEFQRQHEAFGLVFNRAKRGGESLSGDSDGNFAVDDIQVVLLYGKVKQFIAKENRIRGDG